MVLGSKRVYYFRACLLSFTPHSCYQLPGFTSFTDLEGMKWQTLLLFCISLDADISWCSWVTCASRHPVKYLILVAFCCNKVRKKNNLKEAMFISVHGFRGVHGHLALWVWDGGEGEPEGGEKRGERRLDRANPDQLMTYFIWGPSIQYKPLSKAWHLHTSFLLGFLLRPRGRWLDSWESWKDLFFLSLGFASIRTHSWVFVLMQWLLRSLKWPMFGYRRTFKSI